MERPMPTHQLPIGDAHLFRLCSLEGHWGTIGPQAQLGQQLLRLARQVDALEGRFAAAMGHRPPAAAAAARDVTERLTMLEKALHPTSAGARQLWQPVPKHLRRQSGTLRHPAPSGGRSSNNEEAVSLSCVAHIAGGGVWPLYRLLLRHSTRHASGVSWQEVEAHQVPCGHAARLQQVVILACYLMKADAVHDPRIADCVPTRFSDDRLALQRGCRGEWRGQGCAWGRGWRRRKRPASTPRTGSPPTWTAPPSAICCRYSSSSSRRCRPWRWSLRPSLSQAKPALPTHAAMLPPPDPAEQVAWIVFHSPAPEVLGDDCYAVGWGTQAVLQGDNRDLAIMLDNSGEAVPMAILPA